MKVRVVPVLLLGLAACGQAAARAETCQAIDEAGVAALFDRWNASLQTGDPKKVAGNYAERSVLLPTLSNVPRLTPASKIDYFTSFLGKGPVGTIDSRSIEIDCNSAIDAGLYTFRFKDGSEAKARYTFTYHWNGSVWQITSHHSSLMPNKVGAKEEH
ncbi:MAG TPA: DUF4440 domain-containing protein [Tahibacter sp.]|nr:DUF4440 domain-containing protein [Tahibacter sp.]